MISNFLHIAWSKSTATMDLNQKILCYSTLVDDKCEESTLMRHPIYQYSEELKWPPTNWNNYCCWHCCQTLTHMPVPIAEDQDSSTGRFVVFGLFCSFACAKGYLLETQPWSAGDKLLLLEEMAFTAFGITKCSYPAPPRHRLQMFGGDLSIEEFKKNHFYVTSSYSPPLISHPECYEREAQHMTKSNKDTRWPSTNNESTQKKKEDFSLNTVKESYHIPSRSSKHTWPIKREYESKTQTNENTLWTYAKRPMNK